MQKHTKKALVLSVLSLVLCVSMLVGTTFAWFTDSVTTGVNKIQSGTLDVELYYQVEGQSDWTKVTDTTNVFKEGALWEPGYTEVVKLKIVNEGNLALKYRFGVNIAEESGSINKAGEPFKLSDYIYFGIVEKDLKNYDRDDAIAAVESSAKAIKAGYSKAGALEKEKDAQILTMVVYMPTTVGNEANHAADVAAPVVKLGLNLFATQYTYENDSFGNQYDAAAPWTGTVDTDWYFENPDATEFVLNSADDLAGFAAIVNGTATAPSTTFSLRSTPAVVQDTFAGKIVKLGANLDLNGIVWTPIGRIGTTSTDFSYSFKGTFDGQNHTVSNLDVANEGWAGLFGIAHHATLKNVKISNVSIRSNRMAGALVGQLYGSIENCHVDGATIMVVPNMVGDSYDNGDKVGGIVGWLGDNGENRFLTNCSAKDVEVSAYRDVGGIAGYVASSTNVSGNAVANAKITADQISFYYGNKDINAGLIYGRTGGAINDDNTNSSDEASSIDATYSKNGLTLKQDESGIVSLYLVPADYAEKTVTVPEGVKSIGGYAFAYNANIEKIVLPSTVTTLKDRAFRDTTASEVVLNEGLTGIPYQAFRNAANVTSVTIPSTVTTISKEAFQNSGVKTLVIPANVTTIEYGGLRDMKELESVTIEGNVDIPVYAFRACTNLRTVILLGDNVTFGGGSRGMIFTNTENGDGSAITVYVANETVKARLLAADTAAKDYGGYKIVIGDAPVKVESEEELIDALKNGKNVVLTNDVKMDSATTAPYGNKYAVKLDGGVLDGNGNELHMECYGDDYGIMTSGGTVKNITIKEGCRAVMIMYPTQDVILDNVNIGGNGVLYPINTGEVGAEGVDLIVTNSTLAGWTSFGDAIESASFTNVKFEQGTYYNNIYGRVLKPYVNTTLTGCSFVAHMNLDLSSLKSGHKITISNCTVNGQAVTAGVFTIPTTDADYDTALFTVDLPSWASSLSDCIIFQ